MIKIIELAAKLSSWPARLGIIAALAASAYGLRQLDKSNQQAIGAQKVVAKIEKATNENVKKADAARRSVDRIPDSGLLDAYRRD